MNQKQIQICLKCRQGFGNTTWWELDDGGRAFQIRCGYADDGYFDSSAVVATMHKWSDKEKWDHCTDVSAYIGRKGFKIPEECPYVLEQKLLSRDKSKS